MKGNRQLDYEPYIEITNIHRVSDRPQSKGWKFRMRRCKLCGGLFTGNGIRGHIYYAHFYEYGGKYDWRNPSP